MDEFKNNKEGKTEELNVKPFPFFRQNLIALNGFPFAGQQKAALQKQAVIAKDSTERNADGNAGARFVYV